jgi:hypothetical protein
MAHFAKIGLNNIVIGTCFLDNRDILDVNCVEQEYIGIEILKRTTGHDTWLQYSINTRGGKHYISEGEVGPPVEDNKLPFRKNAPSIGWIYRDDIDGFIPPKPEQYPSWILNIETGLWEAPVPRPDDGKSYGWKEEEKRWELSEWQKAKDLKASP